MDPIELTAKSLDEGKKLAAEKLGVSPDQVEVKVLEETKGLFGRMSYKLSATSTAPTSPSEAPVASAATESTESAETSEEPVASAVTKPTRARKKPAAAKAPEEQIHSEHVTLETEPAPAPSTGAPRRLGKKVAAAEPVAPVAEPKTESAPAAPASSAPAPVEEPAAPAAKTEAPKRLGRGRKSEEPVAAKASETASAPAESATSAAPSSRAPREDEGEDDGVVATDEQAERFRDLLQNLLNESGLAVELRITGKEGKYVNLAIDDATSDDPHRADSSYLIGRSGEVLNALQYLANLIGKQQFNDGVRVVLDGAGWREKREEKLQEYTLDVVRQVLEREEEALLDALPAFERRIVHRIVQDIDGVKTYSEGEEPNRRVVISPA